MKTPKKASRKYAWQMRGIRSYASSISTDLQTVQAHVDEAILLFEESHEGHKIEQLPQLPIFEDVPDPSTLLPKTQEPLPEEDVPDPSTQTQESPPEEKEEDVPAGWPRDPTTLDLDVFKPVWTEALGYPGDMPKDIKETVGSEDRSCKF